MSTRVKNLPGPKGSPIVGNMFSLDLPDFHNQLESWVNEYGDVYQLDLGLFRHLVIARPSIIQSILSTRPDGFIRSKKLNKVISDGGVHGVFNAEGKDWSKHRPIVAKGLDVRHQKDFYPAMEPVLKRLYDKWQKDAASGQAFDIQKDLFRFTVDVTASLAFGYPMNTIEQEGSAIQDHMAKVFPMIFKRINMPIPWYKLRRTKDDKEFDIAVTEMNRLVDEFIVSARQRLKEHPEYRENPPSAIEAILVAAEEDPEFTDADVRGNLLTLLMAGEDTTAHTLAWFIYLLTQESEVCDHIRKEADSVLEGNRWAERYEQNAQLKYLEGAAFEAMRFKPVAPLMLWEAAEEIELEGVLIEKGQRILTHHRYGALNEENFTEADSFKPERWLKESRCPVHNTEAYTPFGGGPRYCPGRNLAILEIRMVMSMLLKNFDLELVTEYGETKERMAFVMMSSGYQVRLKARG